MASKEQKIIERKKKYNSHESTRLNTEYMARKKRLKALVDEHGIEHVALASGLTEASLRQYVRTSMAQSISEKTVQQAETVLEGL